MLALLLAIVGFLLVGLFHLDSYLPIWVSVAVACTLSIFVILMFKRNRLGLLTLILFFVYLMPFIHIVPYLWFDFSESPQNMWGLSVNPYMLDEHIIRLTAMIGLVGGIGIASGALFSKGRVPDYYGGVVSAQTIVFPYWLLWVLIGVLLSQLTAPQETVFVAEYTKSLSLLSGFNFSSSWMVSYVILIYAFIDSLYDSNPSRRRYKLYIFFISLLYVVLWLQLLRGDRESLPLVIGLGVVYYYYFKRTPLAVSDSKKYVLKAVTLLLIVLFINMVVGHMRGLLSGSDFSDALLVFDKGVHSGAVALDNLIKGTWSAVLLTPLSVAGDYVNGVLPINYGSDYLDLLLSLPPGFIADFFGYTRPVGPLSGPAHHMTYGLGGTHAVVVSFMNFRMAGVFVIQFIWALAFSSIEKYSLRKVTVIKLSILTTMIMASPHWLWYGEKAGINAVIIWLILAFLYKCTLMLSRKSSYRIDDSRVGVMSI